MRHFLSIGTVAGLSLILALGSQWYILVAVGPGVETDAYFAVLAITTAVFTVLAGGLANVLVPIFLDLAQEEKAAVTLGVLSLVFFSSVLVTAILVLATSWWAPVLLPGFSTAGKGLAVELAPMLAMAAGMQAVAQNVAAVHRAREKYIWPEVSNLVANTCFLIAIWLLLPVSGVQTAAWLVFLRALLVNVLMLKGVGLDVKPRFPSAVRRKLWQQYRPLLFGASIYKTGPIVDRYLASQGPPGTITLLGFALQLYQMFLFVVEKGISAPLVTKAAIHAGRGRLHDLRTDYAHALVVAGSIALVVWFMVWMAGTDGLSLVVGYGNVTREDVFFLYDLMLVLGAMPVAGVFGQLAASCLYGLGETGTVTRVAVVNFLIAIAIKVVLFREMGLLGLAIGIVAYQLLNAVVLHGILMRMSRRGNG